MRCLVSANVSFVAVRREHCLAPSDQRAHRASDVIISHPFPPALIDCQIPGVLCHGPLNCLPSPPVSALTVALTISKVANVSHCCSEKWELCRER